MKKGSLKGHSNKFSATRSNLVSQGFSSMGSLGVTEFDNKDVEEKISDISPNNFFLHRGLESAAPVAPSDPLPNYAEIRREVRDLPQGYEDVLRMSDGTAHHCRLIGFEFVSIGQVTA